MHLPPRAPFPNPGPPPSPGTLTLACPSLPGPCRSLPGPRPRSPPPRPLPPAHFSVPLAASPPRPLPRGTRAGAHSRGFAASRCHPTGVVVAGQPWLPSPGSGPTDPGAKRPGACSFRRVWAPRSPVSLPSSALACWPVSRVSAGPPSSRSGPSPSSCGGCTEPAQPWPRQGRRGGRGSRRLRSWGRDSSRRTPAALRPPR